jgi:hypothetical protein
MSQTMLLTKRLSTFLSQNVTPQLHTLILLLPTGKLLSSSSSSPTSTLRTQATLAVSLWNLYHPFNAGTSTLVAESLPASNSSQIVPSDGEERDLSVITVQLEYGTMSIRSLTSGLLFVAIGPSSTPSAFPNSPRLQHRIASSTNTSGPSSPSAHESGFHHGSQVSLHRHAEVLSGAVSEAGSVGSEGGAQTSIWSMRRRADAVSAALETRLEGFVLSGEGR